MKTVIEFISRLNDSGIGAVVCNYVSIMKRNNVSVIVLTLYPHKKSAIQTVISQMDIPIYSLYPEYNLFFRAINKFLGKQVTSLLLKRKILQFQPCVIHVHTPNLLTFLELNKAAIKNVRLFYTCHSLPKRYFEGINDPKTVAAKILIRDNNLHMIALYEQMADEINSIFGIDNTVVLKNGIDIAKYKNVKESKQEIRQSLNIPTDTYVVGHVGRFEEVKNHVFLLDIFVQLLRHKDAYLVLVGDGDDGNTYSIIKEKIEKYGLKNKVTLLSHRSDVHKLLKAFDVFVFPSLYEGLSMALLEAQAAGLRCVISDMVPDVTRVLDSTVAVSLHQSAEYWCNVILDENIVQPPEASIEEYNIFNIVKRLQRMYIE